MSDFLGVEAFAWGARARASHTMKLEGAPGSRSTHSDGLGSANVPRVCSVHSPALDTRMDTGAWHPLSGAQRGAQPGHPCLD